MNSNKPIIFFGSGWYVVPIVQKLMAHGLDLIVTTEKEGRLIDFCKKNSIKTVTAKTASELRNLKSEISNHSIAILASYGALVPNEIIALFPSGIINIHPSLLPKWKGPSPIQFSILNGETTTGVTLIKLDEELDHGPILSQKPYTLAGNETTEDLLSILFEIGAEMVEDIVVKLEKGKEISETPQNHDEESWSYHIEKKDGLIDLSNLPSLEISNLKLEIDRKVRAYYPWPSVWFVCHPADAVSKPLVSGSTKLSNKLIKLLPEGKIQIEGKKPMSYKDFMNGFGDEGKELLEKLNLSA